MAIATILSRPGISRQGIVGGTIEPEKFALFPDTAGTANFFSTPASDAINITGDIEAHFEMQLVAWAGVERFLFVKGLATGFRDFYFRTGFFGDKLIIQLPTDGEGNNPNASSTEPTGFADNSRHWIRFTYEVSTNAANFFFGTDGINWTQLGTTSFGLNGIGPFDDNTKGLILATDNTSPTQRILGRVYRAILFDGLTGIVAADFNPNDHVSGSTFKSSGAVGEVWTLNGNVSIEMD